MEIVYLKIHTQNNNREYEMLSDDNIVENHIYRTASF